MKKILKSMAGLPLWVQVWLPVLFMTNMASLMFLDSHVGRYTAVAFTFVAMTNVPISFVQGGLTRLLSFPHLVWIPLVIYLVGQLWGASPLHPGPLRTYALVVVAVNSVSLAFDLVEAARWVRGGREVLGLEPSHDPG